MLTQIVKCVGVRFAVPKFVDHLFLDAAIAANYESSNLISKGASNKSSFDLLRQCLGHPTLMLPSLHPVKCVIASMNGMDATTLPERARVASFLWAEGISAEYMPQSGVMMNLLKLKSSAIHRFGIDMSVSHFKDFCLKMD